MNHPRENILNIILDFHFAVTTTIMLEIIQYIYTIMCVCIVRRRVPPTHVLFYNANICLLTSYTIRVLMNQSHYFTFNSASMSLTASGFFWVSAPSFVSASQSSPSHFSFFIFSSPSRTSSGTAIPSKPW